MLTGSSPFFPTLGYYPALMVLCKVFEWLISMSKCQLLNKRTLVIGLDFLKSKKCLMLPPKSHHIWKYTEKMQLDIS